MPFLPSSLPLSAPQIVRRLEQNWRGMHFMPYGMPYGKKKRQGLGIFSHGKLMNIFRIQANLEAVA